MKGILDSILGAGRKTFLVAGVAILAIVGAVFAPKFLPVTDTQAAAAAVEVCVAGASTLPETTPEEVQLKADTSAKCQEIDDKPLTPMAAIILGLGFLGLMTLRQALGRVEKKTDAVAATTGAGPPAAKT